MEQVVLEYSALAARRASWCAAVGWRPMALTLMEHLGLLEPLVFRFRKCEDLETPGVGFPRITTSGGFGSVSLEA